MIEIRSFGVAPISLSELTKLDSVSLGFSMSTLGSFSMTFTPTWSPPSPSAPGPPPPTGLCNTNKLDETILF